MRPVLAATLFASFLTATWAGGGPVAAAETPQRPLVHHDLVVSIDPASHRLKKKK
jgi:hypothetical protein